MLHLPTTMDPCHLLPNPSRATIFLFPVMHRQCEAQVISISQSVVEDAYRYFPCSKRTGEDKTTECLLNRPLELKVQKCISNVKLIIDEFSLIRVGAKSCGMKVFSANPTETVGLTRTYVSFWPVG